MGTSERRVRPLEEPAGATEALVGIEPLKLCLVTASFYPVYAGPAVRFTRYLPGFAARGIQVRVFTATPSAVKAAMSGLRGGWVRGNGELLSSEIVQGVPVHRLRVPDSGWRRSVCFSRALVEFCRQPEFRPDVIQFLSLSVADLPGLRRLRRLGVATVFTKTMMGELPRNRVKRTLLRRYFVAPLQRVDRVVVSSETMRKTLLSLGVKTGVEVIPNGVDLDRFRPPNGEEVPRKIRVGLGIAENELLVLFVGPVSPRKGADLLLEAWRHIAVHRRVHLVLVGPRRDEADPEQAAFRSRLKALVAASDARERIHFVGLVENVQDYMRAADVFVFTSRREGMPNVVPEAMACGLPVVTTPFVGLPAEFGTPGREYLLADFEPERLAATVASVIRDHRLRRDLGASGRRWAETEMDVERSLDRYVELYRNVVSQRNTRELHQ